MSSKPSLLCKIIMLLAFLFLGYVFFLPIASPSLKSRSLTTTICYCFRTRGQSECHVSTFGNDSADCSSFDNPCSSLSQCLINCQSECTIVSELILASSSDGNSGIQVYSK